MTFEFAKHLRALGLVLKPFLIFAVTAACTLLVFRIGFIAWHWSRVLDAGMLTNVFVQGLRFDLVLIGLFFAIPVLLFPLFCSNRWLLPIWKAVIAVYLPACLMIIVLMEASSPSFMMQFDARPNRLFIEYLIYPKEVSSMLWAAYKPQLFMVALLLPASFLLLRRRLRPLIQRATPVNFWLVLVATPLLLIVCLAMIRSTLAHRPVNPSTVALSSDPLVNDLALSSTYTVLYALNESQDEPNGGFRYGKIDDTEAVQTVRKSMLVDESAFVDPELPTLHKQVATTQRSKPKNLVIILEESLGAEFVGSMGGPPITPNLDALRREGLWFDNLYATGTRSVRGIEAVLTGFTPTPARSVVKLGKSQRGFFTLGELLKNEGYATSFMYGGEAHFDNMRRFFVNNGFETIIDKATIENPVFVGSWGDSDEDLFRQADKEFSKPHDKPFFSFVFSVSNHSPYDFPDGRIELYDAEKNTVNNAVKYADYSLGLFFEMAKKSNYWDDTIFLVVADHNSRVYGAELVPISRFHIPALILGGGINAGNFAPVASQIDLAPTLLSLIGVSATHPMIGHDLTRPEMKDQPGRAIMQYYSSQAYMEGDDVVILQKDLPAKQYEYVDDKLVPAATGRPDLEHKALAHSAWSSIAYDKSLYRLPKQKPL